MSLQTMLVATVFAMMVSEGEDSVQCSPVLWELLVSKVVLLSIGALIDLALTAVSFRGSILHDEPRRPAEYLIYLRLVSLALEVVWSGFGAIWAQQFYFLCNLPAVKEIIIGLVLSTWIIFLSFLMTAWCTYDVAGRSWVKMKRYQANLKEMENKYPMYKRSGSRQRNWRQRKVMRAYENSWKHRCRLLFCCLHSTERNRDSFADLARLLSEFFRDLDVVPSDVVVGLLLLRRLQRLEQCSIVKQKRNNTYEFLSGIAITPRTKFVAMNDPKDVETFRNVVHYMHYASAAYGWPWYLLPNGCTGICKLSSNLKCCSGCRGNADNEDAIIVEDNCCRCNYAVIPTMFEGQSVEVIYATYHVDVGETPFFLVVDYDKATVVVSIRGTLSLKDVITDLNAEGEALPINPAKEDWLGHKGMVQAAVYMKSKLMGEGLLEKAFGKANDRRATQLGPLDPPKGEPTLVIVGHSLGAGTAAILAVLLRENFPTLHCYAFAPPGGLLSMPVVEYTKDFVTSVIVGKDVVPRIGLSQMEALRADLINAMKKSNKPKWETFMSGLGCCCCVKQEFALPQRISSAPSISSEEFMRSRRSLRDLREVTLNPNESAISLTVHQPLYPPGRIMHIVRHHPKHHEIKYESFLRRVLKKGEPVFQALWTENSDYGQVLISPGMIQDHMPDQILRALHRVVNVTGPAKPQRRLGASSSPLESRESLGEVRAASKSSSSNVICVDGGESPRTKPSSLLNPSPLIIDADAESGDLGTEGLSDILASLNMSWTYVTSLQESYMEREASRIEPPPPPPEVNGRKGSFSSTCSEPGSTFKEIFGPTRIEDWMAPLASPETLSEISSLSSRASFLLPRDASPLLKGKGRNGLGRLRNGRDGSTSSVSGPRDEPFVIPSHARSFSSSYPDSAPVRGEEWGRGGEGKRVSFNLKKKRRPPSPLYPSFQQQEEYGVPALNAPHYTYRSGSPLDSPEDLRPTNGFHPLYGDST